MVHIVIEIKTQHVMNLNCFFHHLIDDADGVGNYVKIVDFQIISMESCLKDVLFFLMTSIPYDDLNTKFDSYIKYYHESLHSHLKQFYAYRKEFPIDKFTYEK